MVLRIKRLLFYLLLLLPALFLSCAGYVQSEVCDVTGRVILCECGYDSVSLTLSSSEYGDVETVTDTEGNYTFKNVWNGKYTVTPHKEGYTFYPASREISVNGSEVELADFDTITDWESVYGAADRNGEAFSIIQAPDCGFIITGYRDVSVEGPENPDMWIIKTDLAGNIIWEDTRGDSSYPDIAYCSVFDSDGNIVVGGYSDSAGDGSIYMLKYVQAGEGESGWTLDGGWSYLYGTDFMPEKPAYIFQTVDSGYFAGGFSGGTAGNLEDVYGIKTDNDGLNPFTFTYGFDGSEISNAADMILRDPLYAGGFIIAGGSSGSDGSIKAMLLKRDELLADGWSWLYSAREPLTNEEYFSTSFESVKESADSGYICAGTVKRYSWSTRDIYILKTDKDGNEVWSRLIDMGADDFNGLVVSTSDGGFAAGFTSMSLTETNYCFRLMKLNAAGETEWVKEYNAGDDNDVFLRSVVQTYDGGFALCGVKTTFNGKKQVFLIKTDRNGELPNATQ